MRFDHYTQKGVRQRRESEPATSSASTVAPVPIFVYSEPLGQSGLQLEDVHDAALQDQSTELHGGAADMEFSDFLDFSKKNINHHWLPQSRYVPRDIDFIGRLEFFDRDFDVVKTVLTRSGLALLSEGTEQMNRTERDHYKAYYNGKTKALVEDMYREDIERFEYEF